MTSKKTAWVVIVVGLGILLYWCFVPKYKFHYYYSKDKSQVLTRVTYANTLFDSNETYFTPGHYDKHRIPTTYVKPPYSSDRDWVLYVTFHSKGILLTDGNSAEVKNLSDKFIYRPGSYKYYSEHLADDSLIATLRHTTNLAIYSFDD